MAQIDWSQHPQRRDWAQPPHPHGRLQQLQHNFDVRNFTSHGWPGSVALPAATRRCRNLLPTHELSRLNPLVNHKAHLQDQSYLTTSDVYRQDCKYRDGAEAQLGQMHGAFAQPYHKHLNTALTSSMQGTILTSGSMQNNAQACGSTGLDDNFEYHIATMQPNHSTISSSTGQGNCNQSQLIGTAGVNLRLGNDGTPCHAGKCNKISINVPASSHNGGMQSDAQPVAMHNDSLTISDPKLSTSWLSSGGSQDLSTEEKEMLYRAAALQPISDLSAVCSSASADTEVVDKPKLRRNVRISKDPQSVAARQRRQRISSKMRVLQKLVPGGMKMDTASMLEEAAHYLKFLKAEVEKMEAIEQLMNVGKGHVDPSKLAAAGQMLQYAPQNQGAISKSNMHGVSNHNIIPASYQPASL